jgi:(p)ppGpp synthase/HD superfamily hydrolase
METILSKAIDLARHAHSGQKRKYTGQPYIYHPLRVACKVKKLGFDDKVIAAAVLHDVIEDTDVHAQTIASYCGFDVALLVSELTNASKGSKLPRHKRKQIDRAKLATASKEAKIVKLCDRLDNLHDISLAPRDFQKLYAKESVLLVAAIGFANEVVAREVISVSNVMLWGHR